MENPLDILYIDNHLLILNKPNGVLVQGDRSGRDTLLDMGKDYIRTNYKKPGQVFLGLVHRLDKSVSGIVVFARTSKSAARLSDQIRQHRFIKIYRAIVLGKAPAHDKFTNYMAKSNQRAVNVSKKDGKYCELSFKRLQYRAGMSLVEIELVTGRYHQIRAQFAARDLPILGDSKYGAYRVSDIDAIALHACSLTFQHPVRNEILTITSTINNKRAWKTFANKFGSYE